MSKRAKDQRLSKNFRLAEFRCKNAMRSMPLTTHVKAYRYLAENVLEELRQQFGPCSVHSGERTIRYNRKVGGAANSFHVNEVHDGDDVAADVSFKRGTPEQWAKAAERIYQEIRNGKGGIGVYPAAGFIHLDTRDYPSRWRG